MASEALRAVARCVRRLADRDGERASDGELLARFAAGGDGAAFELLVWRHGPMVLGICRRVLRHVQDRVAGVRLDPGLVRRSAKCHRFASSTPANRGRFAYGLCRNPTIFKNSVARFEKIANLCGPTS